MTAAPARAATGPYGGSAGGDLVHVDAVNIAGVLESVADVHVAPSLAQVQSNGLGAGPYQGKRSAARAANIDAPLLGGAIPLEDLIIEAEQTAPPTNANPNVQSLTGPIDASPLLTAEVAHGSAHARWGATDTACIPPGTPISTATSTVADLSVLTVGDPLGDAVVSVVNGEGGAAYTKSDVGLVNVTGQTNKGLQSKSLTQVTGVVLFKGSANEITLNVVAPPELVATATGTAGTTTVTYNQPIVQIIQGGTVTDVLNATDLNTEIALPGVVLRLSLGVLSNKVTTATEASGNTRLLGLELLDITETLTLASVEIAPMAVKATVPAGGVECPDVNPLANLQVDASTGIVLPNGSFQYAITVPNTGACTVNNVKVVLTVTGPNGSTITAAEPSPNTISGLTVTWPDIGSIAPGALKTLKATIKVPSNATVGATYKGTATASGTCDGAGVSKTADSGPIPAVGSSSTTACDLSASSISSSHKEVRVNDFFNEYVRVTNLGRGTCNSITVTVPYPPDTTFVSCTDGCTHNDTTRVVTWTIPSLGSGQSKDLVATFKVNANAPNGKVLGTTVTITSGGRTVTDKTSLPVVTSSNVLNAGAQRSRGILPRTGADLPLGLAFTLLGAGLVARALRRRATA